MKLLKYILGISLLTMPIIAKAQVPVDFSQNIGKYINQNNGVAGLDNSGNVTTQILSPLILSVDQNNSSIFGSGKSVPGSDMFSGLETSYFGGIQNENYAASDFLYSTNKELDSSQSIKISGNPYGAFDAGTSLSVFTEEGKISGLRAGVSGGDYRIGPSIQTAVGSFDMVGFYEDVSNNKARIVVPNVTYDATHVYMPGCGPNDTVTTTCAPLSKGDIAKLKQGMYVVTNSVDPNNPIAYTNGKIVNNTPYAGFVDSWDPSGKFIVVNSWAMLGGSNTANGQVPSTTYESYWSSRTVPTVFIGAPTKSFGRNLFLHYNEGDSTGANTSVVHAYSGEELDIRGTVSKSRSLNMSGLVISGYLDDTTANGDGLTEDSFGIFVGGAFPTLFGGDPGARYNVFNTGNAFIGAPDNNFSDGSNNLGSYDILSEFGTVSSGVMKNLSTRVVHARSTTSTDDTTKATDQTQDDDIHLGMISRPAYRDAKGYTIGRQDTIWGIGSEIRFSSVSGSVLSLCGGPSDTTCGLSLDNNGTVKTEILKVGGKFLLSAANVDSSGNLTGQGTLAFWNNAGDGATYIVNDNPGSTGGFEFYDTQTGGATLSGLHLLHMAYNGANFGVDVSTVGTLKGANATVTGKMVIPFGTPSSSTADCTQGQIEMDADYIYSCVAANTWHRVSNGASW